MSSSRENNHITYISEQEAYSIKQNFQKTTLTQKKSYAKCQSQCILIIAILVMVNLLLCGVNEQSNIDHTYERFDNDQNQNNLPENEPSTKNKFESNKISIKNKIDVLNSLFNKLGRNLKGYYQENENKMNENKTFNYYWKFRIVIFLLQFFFISLWIINGIYGLKATKHMRIKQARKFKNLNTCLLICEIIRTVIVACVIIFVLILLGFSKNPIFGSSKNYPGKQLIFIVLLLLLLLLIASLCLFLIYISIIIPNNYYKLLIKSKNELGGNKQRYLKNDILGKIHQKNKNRNNIIYNKQPDLYNLPYHPQNLNNRNDTQINNHNFSGTQLPQDYTTNQINKSSVDASNVYMPQKYDLNKVKHDNKQFTNDNNQYNEYRFQNQINNKNNLHYSGLTQDQIFNNNTFQNTTTTEKQQECINDNMYSKVNY